MWRRCLSSQCIGHGLPVWWPNTCIFYLHVGCAFRLVSISFQTQLSTCRYIKIVKQHSLEISQPGVDPSTGLTWQMTKRRRDHEVRKETEEKPGRCSDPRLPPYSTEEPFYSNVADNRLWPLPYETISSQV
ncbi:unnamed protein product [Musa acuminata subsp. malaccensis]|uniref:(wild Malaysian banana) hypothetical protein n=1 Tax=Musa acuminata subsp. malaccensis TaxID=214687 RepID=A0A804KGX3_MUSAM|nr:unnamed protein product [Musa acuminata subsp. malaccensis]